MNPQTKVAPATPLSARCDDPTPHVDAAIEAIQRGDVFSADWATLRNYEIAYPRLVAALRDALGMYAGQIHENAANAQHKHAADLLRELGEL
jgi:hypothetical protein